MNAISGSDCGRADVERRLIEIMPELRAWLMAKTRSRDLADDIIQDLAVKVLRFWHQYRADTNFRSWAYVITRNLLLDRWRRSSRRPEVPIFDDTDLLPEFQETQTRAVYRQQLLAAMALMAPERRQILIAIGVNGCSYEDYGHANGMSMGTVKSMLWRARHDLAALLGVDVADDT